MKCSDCNGTGNGNDKYSGSWDLSDMFECPTCEGTGEIEGE